MTAETRHLDTTELEQRVKSVYQEVALDPERDFHFETGRPLAERAWLSPRGARPHPGLGDRLISRASATSSTWLRSSWARRYSTLAAAPAPTASWRPLPRGRMVG